MKKFKVWIGWFTALFLLTACGNSQSSTKKNEKSDTGLIKVVTTNSILGDMVKNVGGNKVDLHNMVPIGTDPHEYEPLPEDITAAAESDVIFYNGLNLETGGNGWFAKLMETAGKREKEDYFAVSKGVEPMHLTTAGKESEQDPHAWLDISNGIIYVLNIAEHLIEKDPDNKKFYQDNAENYLAKLKKLDTEAKSKFADIPKEKALLVTSEGAFKYFSKAYGLTAAFIWEINTENQGTPDQMTQVLEQIEASKVPGLFVETSVDKRSMETISNETGLSIYTNIFTDSVAKKGKAGDSYYSMMEWNLTKIHEGLSQ